MSVVTGFDYPPPAPPTLPYAEPFGQTGVRQYAGRLIAWLCLTVGLAAAAMAYRSLTYSDQVEWKARGQRFQITSGNGQIAIVGVADDRLKNDDGWGYRGGYGNRWANRGPWKSDLAETVGIEGRLASPSADFARGFWLRLKWPTIAALFLVQPLVYGLRRIVFRRKPGADAV